MTSEVNEIVEPEGDIEIIAEEFPKHIDIDLSNRCNLRCRFCFLVSHKPEKWQQLSYDQFLKVTPLLENAKDISLFSKYEPLTCRDFIPIFNKVCEYDIETYFSTNGILLNDDIIDALVGRLTYLTVSVTGFTRESYTKNMSQDKLETVCENLVKLNAAKKVANTEYPKLRITFVGMLDMLDELCQSVDFAVKFEASEGVRMTYFKSYDENMNQYLPLNEPETVAAAVAEASAYAQSLGTSFEPIGGSIDDIEARMDEATGHRWCDMPWKGLSLQSNGDVYPCPVAYKSVGNFFESTFEKIWNGEELAAFRDGVNDPDLLNEDCRKCLHCRYGSAVDPETNDYSKAGKFIAGMKRKQTKTNDSIRKE
jgi:radical SAM protein with 4Fe4S-binding SPASM domain